MPPKLREVWSRLHQCTTPLAVRSGKLVQGVQAVFLPQHILGNWEVVSHPVVSCVTQPVRGTFTDQDLSEVSEQECHDTSFCYKSPPVALIARGSKKTDCQDNTVTVQRTVTCLTVTLHYCSIHMQEYPGVLLGLDERLKF